MPSSNARMQARSPLLNLLATCGLLYGAFVLWSYNHAYELAGVAALLVALFGTRYLLRTIDAFALQRRIRQTNRELHTVRKTQGRARWATEADAKRAGMYRPGGFLLGEFNGRLVYHHGEGAIWAYAPPGSGKSIGSVIPNLLIPHVDGDGRHVVLVTLDISGELYAVCARRQREIGYHVVAIAPWADTMSRELGITIPDAGYNMTLPLLESGQEIKDDAEMLATLMLPGQHTMSEASSYFLDFGRSILVWGLLTLVQHGNPQRMNLVALRQLLMSPPEILEQLLAEASQSDAFGGVLRQYANKLCQTLLNAPEEASAAINTATKALNLYDDFGPLGRHVSRTDGFDFSTIKDRPTCVYLIIPPERITSHGAWLNLALSTAIEQIARDRTNKRVLAIMEEFANASYLPQILRALGLYRKQGIQFAFYSQTASQIRRLYGDDGLRDFLGMCEVIQAFAVRDPETLRMLADLAGHDTVKDYAPTMQPDVMGGGRDVGYSLGATNQGRLLIRPEDIRTLPDDKQLVLYRNLPPFLMNKANYLKRREFRRHADPNPYYRSVRELGTRPDRHVSSPQFGNGVTDV